MSFCPTAEGVLQLETDRRRNTLYFDLTFLLRTVQRPLVSRQRRGGPWHCALATRLDRQRHPTGISYRRITSHGQARARLAGARGHSGDRGQCERDTGEPERSG